MEKRPSWDEYFLNIAKAVSKRATCIRRKYGAVIVDVNDYSIISTGYCGNAAGTSNCCDIGRCFREEAKIPSGMLYDLCKSIHAEENAIMSAGKKSCKGNLIYIAGTDAKTGELVLGKPCYRCQTRIINVQLEEVIYWNEQKEIIRTPVKELIRNRLMNMFQEQEKELLLLKEKGFKLD